MSIQSEITRINGNVQTTLDKIAATGVTVGEGSDALPAAAEALAASKQDKITASGILSGDGSGGITGVSTLPVSKGGTGKTSLTSGWALVGGGSSVVMRDIMNHTSEGGVINNSNSLITSATLMWFANRQYGAAAAETNYTTLMFRGESLNATETTPAVNGAIAWQYG